MPFPGVFSQDLRGKLQHRRKMGTEMHPVFIALMHSYFTERLRGLCARNEGQHH